MSDDPRYNAVTEVFRLLREDLIDVAESARVNTLNGYLTLFTASGIVEGLTALEAAYLRTFDEGIPMEDWS